MTGVSAALRAYHPVMPACGSKSAMATLRPSKLPATASSLAGVVFDEPPLPLKIKIVRIQHP